VPGGAADPGRATVAGDGNGAAPGAPEAVRSEAPHILQKFMPGGFTVPHFEQVGVTGTPNIGLCPFTRVCGTAASSPAGAGGSSL
jgi:hypothetical protein